MNENSIGCDFTATGLNKDLLSALTKSGITVPTAIQDKTIPVALQGSDVIGVAQTGTGKTLAFVLPIIHKIIATNEKALIIVPTRELAIQVKDCVEMISSKLKPPIKTVCLIGGTSVYNQIQSLKRNPNIIVATPGRLRDHLGRNTVRISDVTNLVLDEADRMLDMGFLPDIKKILSLLPNDRQTMLYSATFDNELMKLVNNYMQEPVRIEVSPAGSTVEKVVQKIYYLDNQDKDAHLLALLEKHLGSIIIFCRTKFGVKKLTSFLIRNKIKAAEIHSDRTLQQRRAALDGFKTAKHRVLVATDVAARGIDISSIELVLNYDLPDAAEDYVHRIGRTGRAGKDGMAISFAMQDQQLQVRKIERLIKMEIPLHDDSAQPFQSKAKRVFSSRRRFGGGGRRR
ncbi:MAG: DEAD/DEAH box helicase [Proteobacteria bacterium]|nr:DEAD/DEAH box helicase [Pseudomonadota bacterium]